MIKIACVGDNCVDFYDNTNEAFPGGNPVNVAVYVRRLGGESAYLGAVGTDDHGRLKAEYTIEGMHIREDGYRAIWPLVRKEILR